MKSAKKVRRFMRAFKVGNERRAIESSLNQDVKVRPKRGIKGLPNPWNDYLITKIFIKSWKSKTKVRKQWLASEKKECCFNCKFWYHSTNRKNGKCCFTIDDSEYSKYIYIKKYTLKYDNCLNFKKK